MNRIEFKKLSKELIEEGITIELLNKVQDSGKFSPAMMQKGDEPVKLLKADNKSFWILLDDGSYLKDEKNSLITFDLKTCIVARARYWLLFSDTEMAMDEKRRNEAKEKEIEKEVNRIIADLKKEVSGIVDGLEEIIAFAEYGCSVGEVFSSTKRTLLGIMQYTNPEFFDQRMAAAKQYLEENPNVKEFVISLKKQLDEEDYDGLYVRLKQKGLPQIASFSYTEEDMEVFKRFFHADKINQTINSIQGQSHIKNVAMFNVNKKYS